MRNIRVLALIAGLTTLSLCLIVPQTYTFLSRVEAKRHIDSGCKAFASDWGGKDSVNVGMFQTEFSLAALADPIYLPIAKASDALDASREQSARNGFEREWIDALGTIQGLCQSFFGWEDK